MTNKINFAEVETFLNANPDFLGTFLARNDLSKHLTQKVIETPPPPTLTMSKCVEKLVNQQRIKKKHIIDATMSENERFSEFVKDIAGELNVDALSHKILQNVINLTGSDRGRLFLVEGADEKYLISKLLDVTATSHLDETMHDVAVAIRIPFGNGIAGTVAESRVAMNIKDPYDDPRFDPDIDGLTGYEIRCVLCMPILNKEGDVVGVAEIMNKKAVDHFSEQDEILFTEYLNFCGIGINNARLFQMSIEEIHRNQLLLNLAWQISIGQCHTDQIIKVILEHALQIIKCKFAKVYLLDAKGELFSKVYRLDCVSPEITITKDVPADVYSDIAKQSLDSNDNILCIDLGNKPGFVAAKEIPSDGDKMKIYEEGANWTLCTPIHNPSGECIGCIMFAGKTRSIRNKSDANSVEAFAVYCGLGIYNCQLYETTIKSLTTKQVIMEILSYHMTSEKEEVNHFINLEMPSANEYNIYDIAFDDLVMSDASTVQVCALMFIKMNALSILGISLEHLYHWILTVKKNYKPLLYHNWRHALNVSQTMFYALSMGSSTKFFSPFECICLLVASLCHDLDYQGLASAKHLKSTSLLATVYSTSSSEDQILGRCIMILNAEATNIFQNLTTEKYREAMELIKKAIFSTDIYVYLLNVDYFEELKKKKTPFQNERDKEMITRLTMVSCDLTAFAKPWSRHKILVLAAVLDLLQPQEPENGAPWLSKNEINNIPSMMVDFIDVICLKAFETMAHFDESFTRLYDACCENRKNWETMAQQIDKFDVENELNKSRAGFIDFDEPISPSIGVNARNPDISIISASGGANGEETRRETGSSHTNIKQKERKELERIECEREKEKKEQEEKAKQEKEKKEQEEKAKQEKEKKEQEEMEKKKKEEAERKAKEEKEEEKKKKEMEEKKKKAAEEKESLEEKKKKIPDADEESTPPGSDSLDESRSTISPSPTVSPRPTPRHVSREEVKSPDMLLAKRLSYRQPSENEIVVPPPKRELSRRKSCLEEMAEENMRHKQEKNIRRPSINHDSPTEELKHSPVKSPPKKSQEKIKKQKSFSQPTKVESPLQKRNSVARMESAKQRIKANNMPMGEKRKCVPRAADKDNRKKVQKSGLCSII